MQRKRLFFGMQIVTDWPQEFPEGRILEAENRHLTLVFLGETEQTFSEEHLASFPPLPCLFAPVAYFDRPLFLPSNARPRVAAWHVQFLEKEKEVETFRTQIAHWLRIKEKRDFFPHVTLARAPFVRSHWKDSFQPAPLFFKNICLFQSEGALQYQVLWERPFLAPFEPIDHTADLAFRVRAENWQQLYLHAQIALSFSYPLFLSYLDFSEKSSFEEIIQALNATIAQIDAHVGCPVKAVSWHGKIHNQPYLEWEMIIDV